MKAIIIMGSTSDEPHAKKITDKLDEYNIPWEQHAASAHKQPLKVLEILEANKNEKDIVYVTIAGRSNALSGFVAANSKFPTIGCPPFSDRTLLRRRSCCSCSPRCGLRTTKHANNNDDEAHHVGLWLTVIVIAK